MNKQNILAAIIFAPSILAVVLLLFQGFAFAFTGEWLIPGQQLGIGFITSFAYSHISYKSWAYMKLLNETPEDNAE